MYIGVISLASGEKPYTVVFHGRRLGIQLRELHDIPVVGGLQGYDPDGTGEDGADDAEVRASYLVSYATLSQ